LTQGPGRARSLVRRAGEVNECNRLWLLKNSFQGISAAKLVRKLLIVRSPWTLKFTEITALVRLSTATPVCNILTKT